MKIIFKKKYYLNQIIELALTIIVQLKTDFYLDDESSRYYSTTVIEEYNSINPFFSSKKTGFKIEKSKPEQNSISTFELYLLNTREIVLSLIPCSLFTIANSFVVFLEKKLEELSDESLIKNEQRLETNFSVEELVLLFRMIHDLKPEIFKTKFKSHLFKFISYNFKTKDSSENGISTQSVSNKFYTPEPNAIGFWEKHLHTMLSELRKLK